MAGTGTGVPLTLRCSKCKVGTYPDTSTGRNLVATGRTKPRGRVRKGIGTLSYLAEYRCLDCGHQGWSCHSDMEKVLKRG